MSEIQSVKKAVSKVPPHETLSRSAAPVAARAATPSSSLSGERTAVKTLSWAELSQLRDMDAETKNFQVPPELIELARAKAARAGAVLHTPLVPRPSDEPVVPKPVAPETAVLETAVLETAAPETAAPETAMPRAASSERAPRESISAPPRLHTYAPYILGAVFVGGYVALCYFANTLFASLP